MGRLTCMPSDPQPRVRLVPIPAAAVLVVRGDELDATVIRADATRFHRRFPAWGRSGSRPSSPLTTTRSTPSAKPSYGHGRQSRLRAIALETVGVEIVPTFRVPHITLADPSLDALTQKLLLCDHRVVVNPYHEPEIGPLEGQ